MNQEAANKIAEAAGYRFAEYVGTWEGYDVYQATDGEQEILYVGMPAFVIVKDGTAEMADTETIHRILREAAFEPDNEEE